MHLINLQKFEIKHDQISFQQLKQQRDKLRLYQRRIERSLESDRTLAKQLINKGKKE